jgi:hypothetical protein
VIGDTGLVDLLVRTVVSLAVVLALVALAYVVAKRRGTVGRGTAGRGTAGGGTTRRSARRGAPAGVEVVGRVGLNRSTAAVALRFGDRVVLVTTSEQGPAATLAEMPAEHWDELQTVRAPLDDVRDGSADRAPVGFVEALRQATARHG